MPPIKERTLKVAVSAQQDHAGALVDPRFARAPWIVLVDVADGAWSAHENRADGGAGRGAGVGAAASVIDLGAGAVITGNVGPNAYRLLNSSGITTLRAGNGVTVEEAVAAFCGGALPEITEPTVSGNWS